MNESKLAAFVYPRHQVLCFGRLVLFSATALWLFSESTVADDKTSLQEFAAIIPAASPLTLIAPDPANLERQWKQTAFYSLYSEPVMQPFWEELRKTKSGVLPTEVLGLTWNEFRGVSAGGAALIAWPTKEKSLAFVLIADSTANPKAASTTVEQLRETWLKRKYDVAKRAIQNVEVIQAKIKPPPTPAAASKPGSSKPNPAPPVPTEWFAFSTQGRFVICDRESVVSDVISRISTKPTTSLLQTNSYTQIFRQKDAFDSDSKSFFWFVDPWQLYVAAVDPKAKANRAIAQSYNFLKRQGFDAIKALGGSICFGSNENDFEYETRIIVEKPLEKGAGLLSFTAAKDLRSPPWLPKTLTDVSTIAFDSTAVVNAYGAIYDEIYAENYQGAFIELLTSIETEPDGPEAKVRRDLLECLQPLVIWASDFAGHRDDPNPTGKRQVFIALTSSQDKSLVALQRFFANDDEVQSEKIGQAWIWQAKADGQALFPYNNRDPLAIKVDALAVYQQFILASNDRYLAREVIGVANQRDPTKGMPVMFTNPIDDGLCGRSFRKASAHLKSYFDLVHDGRLQQSTSWEALAIKTLLLSNTIGGPEAKLVGQESLPPFENLKTQFGSETSEMLLASNGWTIRGALKKAAK